MSNQESHKYAHTYTSFLACICFNMLDTFHVDRSDPCLEIHVETTVVSTATGMCITIVAEKMNEELLRWTENSC